MTSLQATEGKKRLKGIRRAALKAKVALSKLLADCSKFNQHFDQSLHLNPVGNKITQAIDPLMDLMNQCAHRERLIERQERKGESA